MEKEKKEKEKRTHPNLSSPSTPSSRSYFPPNTPHGAGQRPFTTLVVGESPSHESQKTKSGPTKRMRRPPDPSCRCREER